MSLNEKFFWLLFVLVLFIAGFLIFVLPVEVLLKYDHMTGYHLYKNAPNPETGLKRATRFYRGFGLFMMFFNGISLMAILYSMLID